ncbi:MAG: endonuclease III [Phycisphaeraceae bacterium]|nr:endonuclease III [Phycisphaerales bacterium]MCB9844103.1 endonuclease III [Phycisphaeraceae bacterium]
MSKAYPDIPFDLPEVTAAQKQRARRIYKRLAERYPDARCALDYRNPHELLIATILSAQSTDLGVNKATPALFAAFPTPADYAKSTPAQVEKHIKSIGLYRNKAKAIVESMKRLRDEYGGEVPRTMDELLTLRGVARKTANVVLGNAFNINMGVVVDTHIERLAKRFDLAPQNATVAQVERHLMALFPRDNWTMLAHLLIAHGRAVCKARGGGCSTDPICRAYCNNAT